MCGITGVYSLNQAEIGVSLIKAMTDKLSHRGPDNQSTWLNNNIALGHTRLSIHDLSQSGNQPMFSFNKEWVIVLNGEIYNFLELKSQLLKENNIVFSSNTDTEVLINAIAIWGVRNTLERCVGMFAFAAYHIMKKKLYLARDRFGEKPLYYGTQNNVLGFASELKSLRPLVALGWNFDVDRDQLAAYMRLSYVPAPHSIYANIKKLDSGSYLEINSDNTQNLYRYWETQDIFTQQKFLGSYEEAVELLDHKLKKTVQLQMASDVPLGAFLSGGIDSSTIVALMQEQSINKINTFSIGFNETAYNEAPFSKAIASHLGTNHTEMYVTHTDALNLIPRLANIYDEPFADSSQIPTYFVSKIAKQHVSVSLSGDGGDEIFGGYVRYLLAEMVKQKILDKSFVRYAIACMPVGLLKGGLKFSNRLLYFCDRLMKLQAIIKRSKNSRADLYLSLCSQISQTDFVINGKENSIYVEKDLLDFKSLSYQEWMMHVDSNTYLIDDILAKVDRAAMAVSLETRVPFLDHRIYEFAWTLPLEYKIQNGISKRVLRDVLYRYVPKKLIDRPKVGFGIPLGYWLRHDLRGWVECLLDSNTINQQGFLNSKIVQGYWKEHLSGRRNWDGLLWNILMFQSWVNTIK